MRKKISLKTVIEQFEAIIKGSKERKKEFEEFVIHLQENYKIKTDRKKAIRIFATYIRFEPSFFFKFEEYSPEQLDMISKEIDKIKGNFVIKN